ncbi:MAG: DUF1697 domain-containing protein [Amphritea sp.]
MNKYISILRGINVGGQKKIRMQDLQLLYEELGLQDVMTYIQSGNVVFCSAMSDKSEIKAKLEAAIETAIEAKYGFQVPVMIRTAEEFSRALNSMPFEGIDLNTDGTKVLLTFLSDEPSEESIAALQSFVKVPEQLQIDGKTVYLYCPNGYGKSKLSNTFIENKLKVIATTRNLKTVTRLCELANSPTGSNS